MIAELDEITVSRLPDFPCTRIFNSMDPEFLNQRKKDLANYLQTLVNVP